MQDGSEMAGLLFEQIGAAAKREGRAFEPADLGHGVGLLLSAAWQLAKLAGPDKPTSARLYAELIRRHADAVEEGRSLSDQ